MLLTCPDVDVEFPLVVSREGVAPAGVIGCVTILFLYQ